MQQTVKMKQYTLHQRGFVLPRSAKLRHSLKGSVTNEKHLHKLMKLTCRCPLSFDHRCVFDASDDFHAATADTTRFDVDIEHTLQACTEFIDAWLATGFACSALFSTKFDKKLTRF